MMSESQNLENAGGLILYDRPKPRVITREVPTSGGNKSFYYADYNSRSNAIYNFRPIWTDGPDDESTLYHISENYDLLFPIIKSHEMQHWWNERIKTADLGMSWRDYLDFFAQDEASAHSTEIYSAFETSRGRGQGYKFLLSLSLEAKLAFANSVPDSQSGRRVLDAAAQSLIAAKYKKGIQQMALRQIKWDLKETGDASRFCKKLMLDKTNPELMKRIWTHMSKLQLFGGRLVDLENHSTKGLRDWVRKDVSSGFYEKIQNLLTNINY